jgi:hypothetical protein
MKICKTCNQTKFKTEFYTHSTECKECRLAKYHANKVLKGYPTYTPKPLPAERTCKTCNQTKTINEFYISKPSPGHLSPKISTICKLCTKDQYRANRETILEKAAAKRIPKPKKPKQPEEVSRLKKAAYKRNKRQSDNVFRLRSNMGSLIATALSKAGFKKTSRTADILGCTFEEFARHIESQFVEGMTWSNRHLWHIDHIVPQGHAQTAEQVMLLNHYTNLRPLWSKDNQRKSSTLTEDSLAHPLIEVIKNNPSMY